MSPSQPLPAKENTIFKKILKCYEQKQYKNGLKLAKQILSNPKFADHGETLAMKGLILNSLGCKDDAYDHVKRGLRSDLKSHVCWHVYGLLQRSDHKYDEAIKCYRNALKWDKDNIQILRDLSMLQIHVRDLEGYRDTRYQLFMLRPTQRVSWIGYAMAYHLLQDYEMAVSILEEFRKTSQSQKPNHQSVKGQSCQERYENSELLLYQAMIYQEAAKYQDALDHLSRHAESEICDKLAVHELKSQLLLNLGRNKEAAKLIKDHLIDRNNENSTYYRWYESALGSSISREEKKVQLYHDFQNKYPKAQMPFRIPLTFVSDPKTFRDMVDTYLRKSLSKGQPALFRDLKSLYLKELGPPPHSSVNKRSKLIVVNNNQGILTFKIQIIQDLVEMYYENLTKHDSFDYNESSWASEDPTRVLWVSYYLAQHYDYLGLYDKSLGFVDGVLEHTPTLIEFHVMKAKVLKHSGKIEEAVISMEEAASLDTADRYLNSKCAKYFLRANKTTEAEELCSKFTREGVPASENLNEMQCMWFQTESALAYQRTGKYGEALKKCIEIDRHFAEITEDQFDFHTYCMRKMTLRAYVGLLRLEDVLKSHHFYFIAAKIAIQVYLKLYDSPVGDSQLNNDINTANMTASELKKLKNKDRREKLREAAEKDKNTKANTSNNVNNSSNVTNNEKKTDGESNVNEGTLEPLVPHKLERTEDPLGEAMRFLRPLQSLARDQIDTHILSFEIHQRKGKVLLMLQSLKRAVIIDPHNATVIQQLSLFLNLVEETKEQLKTHVQEVLTQELVKLIEFKK